MLQYRSSDVDCGGHVNRIKRERERERELNTRMRKGPRMERLGTVRF